MRAENIRALRKALELTQTEFAAQLYVSRDVISNIELKRVEPSEMMINAICKTYDVNREWLETGEGEMFHSRASENELTAILTGLAALDSKSFAKQMIAALAQLTPEQWAEIERFCRNVVKAQQDAAADVPTDSADDVE